MLLEEESLRIQESDLEGPDNENLGFSMSGIKLGSGLKSLLERRRCNFVIFCPSDSSLLLTGHGAIDAVRFKFTFI